MLVFRTKEIHDHSTPSLMPNYGLSDEVKREIGKLHVLKLKFKHILVQPNGKLALSLVHTF
jgi:hypothetical protein